MALFAFTVEFVVLVAGEVVVLVAGVTVELVLVPLEVLVELTTPRIGPVEVEFVVLVLVALVALDELTPRIEPVEVEFVVFVLVVF